jgi:hypothetical protein|tara:strand:+ start:617 stop:931 length:315 start_codon:yes stop_codon:yes gene_type:complete
MRRLLKPLRYKRTDKLRSVVRACEGGIYRRIDENRQLLETLQDNVPQFMSENAWVERWLASQDDFLTQVADAARIPIEERLPAPRPWPGKTPGERRTSGKSSVG